MGIRSVIRSARRPSRRAVLTSVAAVAMTSVVGGVAYSAGAATQQPAIQTSTPRSEKQVTHIDVLRQQLRNYYGDPLGTGTFADTSNYAREARSVAAAGKRWISVPHHTRKTKAVLLDVDDTALATWNYEIFSNWAFNPTTNADFVLGQRFPAVPGMVSMVSHAASGGYAIIYLTGRPASQESATLHNLTTTDVAGGVSNNYPAPTTLNDGEDGLFTKPPFNAANPYPDQPYLRTACADEISQ